MKNYFYFTSSIYFPSYFLSTYYTYIDFNGLSVTRTDGGSLNTRQLEDQWAEPVSLIFHSALRKLDTEPSIGASYQISVHLTSQFQRRKFLRKRPTRNKNCLWWPCLLTDRDKSSNFYRGPSINAS